ncbi:MULTISPECIES: 16S rRNA (cytidine(1402)-2'-O)-methyltransferase [Atopobiaceae]|uniref:Ribosomal RNA small subunit methyltransferase I n=1 Tax=Parafannyhessea umbonata TaxID=604330 RepID=A0A1H9MZX5_9ACTN|nr:MULTISPECIES: 16S rRNA (cytidine(1402)-2'-O)-methyltransferase [Atopobiaceae]SEH36490.1 16S rRNA (cytidine1402-2'-O)-methyltransferase [Parafannyhessea umbonata]SER29208.1 16S rRNA (cytidine1402-2'-O)-methyltransferase [Parafannyhessea umbonata]SJZ38190.1 16S rRNA (cytidine1402-2'-O)-methyltransferase [Olsenella sp. KH1P3]
MTVQAEPSCGVLSIVGTPIGNLGDASPRVVETLSSADLLLCEDTRVTSKLLTRFDIHVSLERADENVLAQKVDSVLRRLESGQRVAFVSDAGMPGVSDPGQRLVDAALDHGVKVEVIPGPSAVTCALVASGLPMDHFFFEGFLPRKAGAMTARLEALAMVPGALVVYESPRRAAATLERIAQVFPQRKVALVRELTKLHEEVVRGTSPEVSKEIGARESLKGECVIVIGAPGAVELDARARQVSAAPASLEEAITEGLEAGEHKSALAKRLAKLFSMSKAEAYDAILAQEQASYK